MIDILFTAPHNAVELAALLFCWFAVVVVLALLAAAVAEL